jgi:hypothetical protein
VQRRFGMSGLFLRVALSRHHEHLPAAATMHCEESVVWHPPHSRTHSDCIAEERREEAVIAGLPRRGVGYVVCVCALVR